VEDLMLVVKIEMWPHGRQEAAYEIGRTYIANDGTGDPGRGNYKVAVCRKGSTEVPREIYPEGHEKASGKPAAARRGEVHDYPRAAYNVWRLIARSLLAAFPEEDPSLKSRSSKARVVLDATVAKGLRAIRDAWRDANGLVFDRQAVAAAQDWLDAADR
jgi:hypothetical protein